NWFFKPLLGGAGDDRVADDVRNERVIFGDIGEVVERGLSFILSFRARELCFRKTTHPIAGFEAAQQIQHMSFGLGAQVAAITGNRRSGPSDGASSVYGEA